jgi:hypothetical protein
MPVATSPSPVPDRLTAAEAAAFASTPADRGVAAWLTRTRRPTDDARRVIARRRRAALAAAEEAGFFTLDEMRDRRPALAERFCGPATVAPTAGAGLAGLAARLFAAADADAARSAAAAERRASAGGGASAEVDARAAARETPTTVAALRAEMVRIYLEGEDVTIDYARIDGDAALDDAPVVAAEVDAHAQEAWFDGQSD